MKQKRLLTSICFVLVYTAFLSPLYAADPFLDWLPQQIIKDETDNRPMLPDDSAIRQQIVDEFLNKNISIEGLVWNTPMPQAIINGEVYKLGDEFEGAEIVNIDKEGITFLYKGNEIIVKMSKKL